MGRYCKTIAFLTLFWGLYAGALIDRYSRKNIFIITNLVCGSLIGSIAFYGFIYSSLPNFLVFFVFAVTIFNYNIHYPTLYAFGQEITEKEKYGKLNSYIEVQGQATSVLAGAFAALLLILPGFATDFLGLLIIFPFTRKLILKNVSNKHSPKSEKQDYINGEFEDIKEDDDK